MQQSVRTAHSVVSVYTVCVLLHRTAVHKTGRPCADCCAPTLFHWYVPLVLPSVCTRNGYTTCAAQAIVPHTQSLSGGVTKRCAHSSLHNTIEKGKRWPVLKMVSSLKEKELSLADQPHKKRGFVFLFLRHSLWLGCLGGVLSYGRSSKQNFRSFFVELLRCCETSP